MHLFSQVELLSCHIVVSCAQGTVFMSTFPRLSSPCVSTDVCAQTKPIQMTSVHAILKVKASLPSALALTPEVLLQEGDSH